MKTINTTDVKTKSLIDNFVRGAIANGAGTIYAKLFARELTDMNSKLSRRVRQIRNTECLARYWDELGNEIRLDNDGLVRQF